jgi:predicted acyltransferase
MNASLLFALSFVLLWFGILWVLYRRRIFLKV